MLTTAKPSIGRSPQGCWHGRSTWKRRHFGLRGGRSPPSPATWAGTARPSGRTCRASGRPESDAARGRIRSPGSSPTWGSASRTTRTCSSAHCFGRSSSWGSPGATRPRSRGPGALAPPALRGVRSFKGTGHHRDRAPSRCGDPVGLAGARCAVGRQGSPAHRGPGLLREGPRILLRGQGDRPSDHFGGPGRAPSGRAHQEVSHRRHRGA